MEQVLAHVKSFRALCQQLPTSTTDPSLPLLAVYELEAQLTLSSPTAHSVMDTMEKLRNVEPKTYETIAGQHKHSVMRCCVVQC